MLNEEVFERIRVEHWRSRFQWVGNSTLQHFDWRQWKALRLGRGDKRLGYGMSASGLDRVDTSLSAPTPAHVAMAWARKTDWIPHDVHASEYLQVLDMRESEPMQPVPNRISSPSHW